MDRFKEGLPSKRFVAVTCSKKERRRVSSGKGGGGGGAGDDKKSTCRINISIRKCYTAHALVKRDISLFSELKGCHPSTFNCILSLKRI